MAEQPFATSFRFRTPEEAEALKAQQRQSPQEHPGDADSPPPPVSGSLAGTAQASSAPGSMPVYTEWHEGREVSRSEGIGAQDRVEVRRQEGASLGPPKSGEGVTLRGGMRGDPQFMGIDQDRLLACVRANGDQLRKILNTGLDMALAEPGTYDPREVMQYLMMGLAQFGFSAVTCSMGFGGAPPQPRP